MDYQTRTQSTPAIDEGLRQYMMSVYNYMASGLALTGCCISPSWNCDVYEFWNKRYVCF